MKIVYPNGSCKAVTFRFDDGVEFDRGMVKLLNKYNLKATFYPIAGRLDSEGFITSNEIPLLYKGHEIGNHTYSHIDPRANYISAELLKKELEKGKKTIEKFWGKEVKGYAYVCSSYGDMDKSEYKHILEETGHSYAIMGRENNSFIPDIKDRFDIGQSFRFSYPDLLAKANDYVADKSGNLSVMLVMAHSYEFNDVSFLYDWDYAEKFFNLISNKNDIWYATNGEIIEYLLAVQAFKEFNKNRTEIKNITDKTIYAICNGKLCTLKSGEKFIIKESVRE